MVMQMSLRQSSSMALRCSRKFGVQQQEAMQGQFLLAFHLPGMPEATGKQL
jgi:hypothetical protein